MGIAVCALRPPEAIIGQSRRGESVRPSGRCESCSFDYVPDAQVGYLGAVAVNGKGGKKEGCVAQIDKAICFPGRNRLRQHVGRHGLVALADGTRANIGRAVVVHKGNPCLTDTSCIGPDGPGGTSQCTCHDMSVGPNLGICLF